MLVVSGDVWTDFDYATLRPRVERMARDPASPRAHLVMVPCTPRLPRGDFVLRNGMLALDGGEPLVYGNIGLHDTALFAELPRLARLKMLPLWQSWIRRGWVSGELYRGPWANVGTPDDLAALDALLQTAPVPDHHRHAKTMNARSPMNPLLDFSGLPRFDAIRPEDVAPAIDELVARARAAAEGVATDARPATWDTVVAPLDDALDRLDRSWSAVNHLNAVVSTPALRDAYHASLPKITALYADLAQDERLYARYKALAAAPAFAQEDAARRKVVANELRDFRAGRRRAARGAEGAPQVGRGRARRPVGEIRRQRARRDQRFRPLRRRRSTARRDSRRRPRGGERRRARERAAPAGS